MMMILQIEVTHGKGPGLCFPCNERRAGIDQDDVEGSFHHHDSQTMQSIYAIAEGIAPDRAKLCVIHGSTSYTYIL